MKILKNKLLVKLIAGICLFFTLFNFVGATKVYATSATESESEGWGGVLIKPVIKLLTAIADGIIGFLNKNIEGQSTAFIKIEGKNSWWSKWGPAVVGIITGVIFTAVVLVALITLIPAGGVSVLVVGKIIKIAVPVMLTTGTAGYLIADVMDGSYFSEDIYLPVFKVSLDKIFSNNIQLLDVNFFHPMPDKEITVDTDTEIKKYKATVTAYEVQEFSKITDTYYSDGVEGGTVIYTNSKEITDTSNDSWVAIVDNFCGSFNGKDMKFSELYANAKKSDFGSVGIEEEIRNIINAIEPTSRLSTKDVDVFVCQDVAVVVLGDQISGGGNIQFTPSDWDNDKAIIVVFNLEGTAETVQEQKIVESTAKKLQEVISTWYFILRNIAIIVLMLVLIYIGIRIVIGSTAGEKAKYKERLMDWLVALCLVFVMHYIMVFAVEIVAKITELVGTATGAYEREAIIKLTDSQYEDIINNKSEIASQVNSTDDNKYLYWNTDLMGQIKIYSQQEKEGTEIWVGMAMAYVILVFYMVFFIWTYLKRVLYMAFLTMISPLVAMTYPIDKINDGKAQAFNMWFREYIFNLLIQPMHLLLYTVLVVSAYELAAESAIYTLVAIGFMIPAEKLIRKFFGFEKAQTPGLLSGTAGAALAMTGIQRLFGHHPKGKGPEKHTNEEESNNIKQFSSKEGVDVFGTLADRGESSSSEETIRFGAKEEVGKKSETELGLNSGEGVKAGAKVRLGDGEIGRTRVGDKTRAGIKVDGSGGTRTERANTALGRVGKTISGVAGSYARQLGNKALKRIQNGRPVRAMLRGATGLAGGAFLGLTGAALGIASGDPNKVLQYASTGALAGYGAGDGLANSVVDTFSVNTKELVEEAEVSYYGDEYASKKFEEQLENDLKSEKYIEQVRILTGWSRNEAKEFLDTTGKECYESGVRDVDDMLAIKGIMEEEDKDKRITSIKEAIAATKLKNQLPQKISDMTPDKVEKYEKKYVESFKPKLRKLHTDWSEEQINQQAKEDTKILIKDMKNLESAKSELTKV